MAIYDGLIAIKIVANFLLIFSPYWIEGVKKVYALYKIWVLFCHDCVIKSAD